MKKVVLLKSPTCMPCKIVGPILESLCKEFNIEYKEVMSNTDEGSNLVQTLSVRQVPTYALYENDVFVKQKGGIATKDQLKEWIMND